MKKRLAAILTAGTLVLSLAGCGSNANSNANNTTAANTESSQGGGSGTETTAGTTEAAAESDKILTVALSEGGKTLNPTQATDITSAVFVNAAYDQLVTFGMTKDGQGRDVADTSDIQPSLAKSWEVTDDGLNYLIHLDESAKFANGDPVNADAVVFSFDRIKNSNYTGFLYSLANIETMEKQDDYTINFQLSKPCTIFFNLMQMHIFSIVNPGQLADMTEEEIDTFLTTSTAGSGAFTIDKWDATTEAVLSARNDYWKGKAPLDKVIMKVIPEASNRILLADKGDVDIALKIPPKDLKTLEGNGNLDIRDYQSVTIVYVSFNMERTPLDNQKVRQALNYAMPYNSIVDDVLAGRAAKLDHVVPAAMPGYLNTNEGVYTEDLEKAKALLAEAGYPDGFDLKLTVSSGNQDYEDVSILLQSQLSKIGVNVTIDKMERAQFLDATRNQNFDIALCAYTSFVNDPGYFFGNCLYSKGEYNYGGYASDEVDALWEEAESSNNLDERYALYGDAQMIAAQDAAWAPLYENSTIVVLNKDVKSYLHYADGAIRLNTIEK